MPFHSVNTSKRAVCACPGVYKTLHERGSYKKESKKEGQQSCIVYGCIMTLMMFFHVCDVLTFANEISFFRLK